jgi:hypothetical protein
MAERPIIFSGPMVRAILEGRKTQTRRVVKPQPPEGSHLAEVVYYAGHAAARFENETPPLWMWTKRCPYGQPGDLLYVKEAWKHWDWTEDGEPFIAYGADDKVAGPFGTPDDWDDRLCDRWAALSVRENYKRFGAARDPAWHSPLFLPKWAARIWLRVTDVRVERVQGIGADDARAEGCPDVAVSGAESVSVNALALEWFADIWDSINAKRGFGWDVNPWVWVITFERTEAPR